MLIHLSIEAETALQLKVLCVEAIYQSLGTTSFPDEETSIKETRACHIYTPETRKRNRKTRKILSST